MLKFYFQMLMGLAVCSASEAASLKLELQPLWPKVVLQRALWFGQPPGDARRFVMEQRGRILILPEDQGSTNASLFLDISDRKPFASNEEGLLGLAFHPKFSSNGKFYIYYSQQSPRRSVVSEMQVSKSDPNRADLAGERILFTVPQPYANHNGGCMIFGPDNYLYISLGDGGAANDPHENGQNLKTLLGKILRVDVDSRTAGLPYGIPRDNPFVGRADGEREEIWAYGLRNVWRFSFDRATGELWAGDVGQNKFEEVDVIVRGGNYGWNWREAFHPFKTNGAPPVDAKFISPVVEYPHLAFYDTNTTHSPGLSITGGYVYRGRKLPALQGAYVYADFAAGTIWALRRDAQGRVAENWPLYSTPKGSPARSVASFGEDTAGELHVLAFEGGTNGRIYGLVEAP